MKISGVDRPNLEQVLQGLKDFQRDTVEYVFHRMYLDDNRISRFLIADEVGLGKTLVARGVIAKTIDYLWDREKRIDVVYICSNQDIAQQNIDRLNITSERKFQHASRATLLPIKIQQLRENHLNFVSLTPNTSFKLSSQTGWARERVVIYYMLRNEWDVPDKKLRLVVRGDVKDENWNYYLSRVNPKNIDPDLRRNFLDSVQQQPNLRAQFQALTDGTCSPLGIEFRSKRNKLIGEMRQLLAKTSLSSLEPDLVILDEFQRFKYLLDDNNEIAILAQELFNYPNVKVLLLSATPYKMYTLQGEQDDDHAKDFIRTVSFLLNGHTGQMEIFKKALSDYQKGFFSLAWESKTNQIRSAKENLENVLKKVMSRTERLAVSENRQGMLIDRITALNRMSISDLTSFIHLDRISNFLEADDQVEYWKSSAYPLNLMEDYKLKRKFESYCKKGLSDGLFSHLRDAQPSFLKWQSIQGYQQVNPSNARLRALLEETLESDNWKLLWLPPALPYYQPEGLFDGIGSQGFTKALVFSAWRIVPKMISVLLSYEAERQIMEKEERDFEYSELTTKRRRLLNFALSDNRLTGMPILCMIYPCLSLAKHIDPLQVAREFDYGGLTSSFYLLQRIRLRVESLLDKATDSIEISRQAPVDERWYWAALAILDRFYEFNIINNWLENPLGDINWNSLLKTGSDQEEESSNTRFGEHVIEFINAFRNPQDLHLGKQPNDLGEILARVVLAGPATCALRSFMRVTNEQDADQAFLAAAAQVGFGFRTLYNQPEATVLLQTHYPKEVYWKTTLKYGMDGNIQSVLDEYFHILLESLGLVGHDVGECVIKMGQTIRQALSLRAPSLRFDEIVFDDSNHQFDLEKRGIRCRYALRFGSESSDDAQGVFRDVDVRVAFNSPFRPFVLATTSIGQEGLDFHQYCHKVVHWNLPSNPVDFEQREGRVHRYKCHVIRRNLVSKYGFSSLDVPKGTLIDPWAQLFGLAVKERLRNENDLVPFWIYEKGDFRIERLIPLLPLSREIGHLHQLKKSLVAYRSVIGQSRQPELLEFLANRFNSDQLSELSRDCMIDLTPKIFKDH